MPAVPRELSRFTPRGARLCFTPATSRALPGTLGAVAPLWMLPGGDYFTSSSFSFSSGQLKPMESRPRLWHRHPTGSFQGIYLFFQVEKNLFPFPPFLFPLQEGFCLVEGLQQGCLGWECSGSGCSGRESLGSGCLGVRKFRVGDAQGQDAHGREGSGLGCSR